MFGIGKGGAADAETRANRLYRAFAPVAARYRFEFSRPREMTPGGRPSVVFLGNHSSGKSTIVNSLLGDPPVQTTGVAPTDDAFTVLIYGETEGEFYGPSALGRLPAEFQGLSRLGPDFLQHLAVKVRAREYLRGVNLVDSPGMIDTPEGTVSRTYDFTAAVRAFCGVCDLVLFLFDPEKPGTTGETVDVLAACLHGMEFKLRVLLNKADTFDSMEDFARAYGTLCWNLARILHTKDLPPILSTWTPRSDARMAARIPLEGFEKHRAELLEMLRGAASRRFDALVAGVQGDFARLCVQARVLSAARAKLFRIGVARALVVAASTAAVFALAWYFAVRPLPQDASLLRLAPRWLAAALAGAATFAAGFFASRLCARRYRARLSAGADSVFRSVFAEKLAAGRGGEWEQHWAEVRPDVSALLAAGLSAPLFSWGDIGRIDRAIAVEIPAISSSR